MIDTESIPHVWLALCTTYYLITVQYFKRANQRSITSLLPPEKEVETAIVIIGKGLGKLLALQYLVKDLQRSKTRLLYHNVKSSMHGKVPIQLFLSARPTKRQTTDYYSTSPTSS